MYESRVKYRTQFGARVKDFKDKLQIGVRGAKIGPEWTAIDLYDKSELIDYNYDLQNLPFPDGSFDCIVCNAVLEHVREVELAVYEMRRVLHPGGQVWVEVPFLQAYHAHPHDFWRCTLPGIRRWFADFDEVRAGIFEGFAHEAQVLFDIFARDLKLPAEEAARERQVVGDYVEAAEGSHGYSKSLYMAVFYWGEKPRDRDVAPEKRAYLESLKKGL
jgi:SAM-dependent methyltransferase